MKIKKLRARGIGSIHDEMELPIEQLGDAQVIAIHGKNGSCKSTSIEAIPGALYGNTPSRGPLAALANAKNSLVEMTIETDQEYTIRRVINAVRKQPRSEAYLIDAKGEPLNDGKVSTFDAEIDKRFASERAYLAGGFNAQKRNGQFLEIPKSERKALFIELLRLELLQQISKAAGDKAQALDTQIACQRAELEQAEKNAAGAEQLRGRLSIAESTKAELTATREALESEIENARQAHDDWLTKSHKLDKASSKAQAEARRLEGARETAERDLQRVQGELSKVSAERARLVQQLGARAELSSTVAAADGAEGKLADLEKQIAGLRAMEAEHHKAVADWQTRCAEVKAGVTALAAERDKLIADWRSRCAKAKSGVATMEAKRKHRLQQAETAVSRCTERLDAAEGPAKALDDVPCHGAGDYAGCPLIQGATTAASQLDELRLAWRVALKGVMDTKQDTADLDQARHELDELLAEEPSDSDTGDLDKARQTLADLQAKKPEQSADTDTAKLEAEAHGWHQRQRDAVAAQAKLEALDEAQVRAEDLDSEAGVLRGQLKALRVGLSSQESAAQDARQDAKAAGQVLEKHRTAKPVLVDEESVRRARDVETQAAEGLARLRVELEAAEKATLQVEETRTGLAGQLADLDDWRHMQKAFGADGIQALEVDAAGPEVSELINELLHSCYGSRFSVALETTALKKDGKGTKEIFDLRVIDTEQGTDGSASDLSGGERVLVAEALSLAVAIFNARRSQIPILDLWRDESAGALDHERAPLYIEMLRKALAVGGFHRIYFVAHQPALWALADKQVLFEDGKCRLVDAS